MRGSVFPFHFGRQARIGPAGVRVRLKITHVADRCVEIQRLQAVQCDFLPGATIVIKLPPVKGGAPSALIDAIPTVRKPELVAGVAAISHECQVFAIAHQTSRQLIRTQELLMTRGFVIKRKGFAVVADFNQSTSKRLPLHGNWQRGA